MIDTTSIDSVVNITEVRAKTTEVFAEAERTGAATLVQRNNKPVGVIVPYDKYRKLVGTK